MTRRPTPSHVKLFVGEWIAALGFKQKDVAEGAGISEAYLSEMIGPRQKVPSIPVLKDIADTLGLSLPLLFQPPPPPDAVRSMSNLDPVTISRLSRRS